MTRSWFLGLLLASHAGPVIGHAHGDHDVLQSVFVRVEPTSVVLEWSATTSPAGAASLLRSLDPNADGQVDATESRAFGRRVAAGLRLRLDGHRVRLGDVAASIPEVEVLRGGDVPVRLAWTIPIAPLPAGPHQLQVRNQFKASRSAYLCNAVLSEDTGIRVTGQRRDRTQRVLTMAFTRAEPVGP